MKELIVKYIDALIPLSGAALIFIYPQIFIKKGTRPEVEEKYLKNLKKIGLLLLAIGAIYFITGFMKK